MYLSTSLSNYLLIASLVSFTLTPITHYPLDYLKEIQDIIILHPYILYFSMYL